MGNNELRRCCTRSKVDAIELAKKDEKIAAEIAGKEIKKEIYVPGKLVNIVAI